MGKRYTWYNNGIGNIRVFEGDKPPENAVQGYIITKSKTYRLNKINKSHEKKVIASDEKIKRRIEKIQQKLDKEIKERQSKLYPEL
jgi:hypothetical protein